ncbi:Uncharacterised protein [Candidatus Tiddalikarchaeum anstoanum]|nr:Uncharacterised protein [Candidatus Tiddalikarchaeum anstoanum]
MNSKFIRKVLYLFLIMAIIWVILSLIEYRDFINDYNFNSSLINCNKNMTFECQILNETIINYYNTLPIKNDFLRQLAVTYSLNSNNDIETINNISKNVHEEVFNLYDKEKYMNGLILNSETFYYLWESSKIHFRYYNISIYNVSYLFNLPYLYSKKTDFAYDPLLIFYQKGGECKELSILTSALYYYMNINSSVVCYGGNHCWVEVYINNTCAPVEASMGNEYDTICCNYRILTCNTSNSNILQYYNWKNNSNNLVLE